MLFPSGLPLLNIIWVLSTGLPPSQKRLWMQGFRFEQNKSFHMLYMVKMRHTHIYIYIHIQPSDYLGIHAYIPVYTYHLLIHEPQGPPYHVKLWRLHDYTKQEEMLIFPSVHFTYYFLYDLFWRYIDRTIHIEDEFPEYILALMTIL